jgi:hypothetical protein
MPRFGLVSDSPSTSGPRSCRASHRHRRWTIKATDAWGPTTSVRKEQDFVSSERVRRPTRQVAVADFASGPAACVQS